MSKSYEFDTKEKRFWLAFPTGWSPVIGHEVKIGTHSFAIVVMNHSFYVIETITGALVRKYPTYYAIQDGYPYALTNKAEQFAFYKKTVIPPLVKAVQERPDLPTLIKERLMKLERYGIGERPLIEVIG